MSGVLLDTCAWIYLGENEPMTAAALAAIAAAQAVDQLFVPTMAVLEVVQSWSKGRIVFRSGAEARAWIATALAPPGIRTVALSAEIAIEAYTLPEPFHRDPADRVIVATARLYHITVITRDARILAYVRGGHVAAIGA